jgi:protein-disulfide isomerase
MEQFKKDVASSTLRDKIQADQDSGTKAGVNATPTFFVNGKAISGYTNYEEFKTIIQATAKGSSK